MQKFADHPVVHALQISDSAVWAPPPGDVRSAPFRTG